MKISVCKYGSKEPKIRHGIVNDWNKKYSAFTLAEMMVVMLIMSIILAAMAPVMTTRGAKSDNSSPWRYSPDNLSDAYFGPGDSQIAMIGQPNRLETDDAAKLIINSSDTLKPQISFKRNNATVGRLMMKETNLLLGDSTFDKHTTGSYNIAIGDGNLTELTTGSSNIAIGDGALAQNTSGGSNTAIGTSLDKNTTGEYNTALGDDCLKSNIEGSKNVAVGNFSLNSANSSWNVAVGVNAYKNGTGGSNTIIGGDAMAQSTGDRNVAVGANAMWYGSGSGNTAVGPDANYRSNTITAFSNSTAVGNTAYASGASAIAIGYSPTASNADTIAIGHSATASNGEAIAIGLSTEASGNSSIAIGSNTGSLGPTKATQNYAVAIGDGARALGVSSTALGDSSLANNTNTIAIGLRATSSNNDSISIGTDAKSDSSNGVAIGKNAYVMHGGIAIGNNARSGATNSGYYGIAIGNEAKVGSDYSVSIGYNAGNTNSGSNNTALGTNACKYVSGSNKTCIGALSGPTSSEAGSSNSDEIIYLGSSSATVYIPGDLVVNGNVLLGRMSDSYVAVRTIHKGDHGNQSGKSKMGFARSEDWHGDDDNFALYNAGDLQYSARDFYSKYLPSDSRLKYIEKENTSGLDKIRQLKVFNFTFKKDEKKTPHVGVIAQDLQKIFPNAVKKGADGFLSIRMEDMFFAMVNAIKELDLKYQAQEKRINDLEKQLKQQDKRLKILEAKIK